MLLGKIYSPVSVVCYQPPEFVDLGTNMLLFHVPSCNPEYFRYGVFKCHIIVPISSQVQRKSSIFGESQAHLDPFFHIFPITPPRDRAAGRGRGSAARAPVASSRESAAVRGSVPSSRPPGRCRLHLRDRPRSPRQHLATLYKKVGGMKRRDLRMEWRCDGDIDIYIYIFV